MTAYALARPVPGPRIVPYGEARLASDVLPNGQPGFRITQRFDDVNPAFPANGPHRATDLGNFNCGPAVYSVWPGKVQTIGPDQYGALGIIIDHGAFGSVYWHLNAFSVPNGATVAKGQQIGIVGKTGLGAVCHLHFEIKVAGIRIDPEPYLLGAPLVIEDDDVKIPAGIKHIAQAVVGVGNRIRVDPLTATGARILDSSIFVQVYGLGVKGQPYTLGGVASDLYAWVAAYGETGYVAEPLLKDYQLTPTGQRLIPAAPADCSAQDQTIAQLSTKLARASTSAVGAAQAATATVEALR